MSLTSSPTLYTPEWQENGYVDKCPFEKGQRRASPYLCKCRHMSDLFYTRTEFEIHCKLKCHKLWVSQYQHIVHDDIDLLKNENTFLKRENAILHVQNEKLTLRIQRLLPNVFYDTDEKIEVSV
jgi:hypothetical protein